MYKRISQTNAQAESYMNYLGFHLLEDFISVKFLRNMFSKLSFLLSQVFLPLSRFGQQVSRTRKLNYNGKKTSVQTFCELFVT